MTLTQRLDIEEGEHALRFEELECRDVPWIGLVTNDQLTQYTERTFDDFAEDTRCHCCRRSTV